MSNTQRSGKGHSGEEYMIDEYFGAERALTIVIGGLTHIISLHGIFLDKLSNKTLSRQYQDILHEQQDMKNQLLSRLRVQFPGEELSVPNPFGAISPPMEEASSLPVYDMLKLLNRIHTAAIDLFEDISLRCEDPISGEFIHVTADKLYTTRLRLMKDIQLGTTHTDYFQ
jgi:hypothetical protein